MYWTTTH